MIAPADLRDHLGLKDDAAGNATASRLFNVAKGLVARYAPACPDDVTQRGAAACGGLPARG